MDTIPNSMCNHASTLLFATGKAIYNVSGPTVHSLTFTGKFLSAYSSTSPILGATLVGYLSALERTIKPPPRSSSPLTSAFVLRHLAYFSCVGRLHTSVYLLIGPEPAPCYTPVQTF